MKKSFLIVVAAALTSLVACKKDKDKSDNPSNPGNGSSKVVKRIVETENGVNTTITFTYDASKRLTSMRSSDNAELTSFTYDNNGNLTKLENKEDDTKITFEFTYNNGVPVSGKFKSFEVNGATETLEEAYDLAYTVANGLVTKIKIIIPANEEEEQEAYEEEYNITYTNGNVTRIESVNSPYPTVSTFTYGNKKPIFPNAFKHVLDPSGFSLHFFAKNEILTMHFDMPGTELDNVITNQYTYDAQGYVLTANDGETQSRFEY